MSAATAPPASTNGANGANGEAKTAPAPADSKPAAGGAAAAAGTVTDAVLDARIREILKTANLDELTAKKVRSQLETEYKIDLSARKEAVNSMLSAGLAALDGAAAAAAAAAPSTAGSKKSAKAAKPEPVVKSQEELDAELARSLGGGGGRPRRGAAEASYVKAEKAKKKAAAKAENPTAPKKKSKRPVKQVHLSIPLANFMGVDRSGRGEVNKKIWGYVREHKLQDPADKRQIILDDTLKLIFGATKKRVGMFKMWKFLAPHMKNPEQVVPNDDDEDDDDDDEEDEEEEEEEEEEEDDKKSKKKKK